VLCHAGGQQLGKRSEGDGAAFHSHQNERGSRATEGSSLRGRVAELATSRRRGVEREEPNQHPREEASNHRPTIRCAGMEFSVTPFHDQSWSIYLGPFLYYASHLLS
jgi:hypothetical protein